MNRDHRIYRRSTLLQLNDDPSWSTTIDGLEVVNPPGGYDHRFQLVLPGHLFLPACSLVSRTDDDAWFLDTGVEVDEGRVYIGQRDFEGMASVCGYVAKASVSRVNEENTVLKNDLAIARNLISDLRSAVAGLVGASTLERSAPGRTISSADRVELEAFGDTTDSSDLDFNAL